ncbi:methyl-accepting chemotaxis protein [Rhizobium lemnae]|uniref:Methyl-accepting chemotaxis protein n=1 Tax=Rhizobium lemnae TaxID=1214924 RepID=A0ABV8EEF9_9HYPH|nr:methyl-accepting chemotaxis protein [Rhizobium lemnae]MCJ8508535.1 methyl-accepting chemotaxis protein [Rhizobium lemnae]
MFSMTVNQRLLTLGFAAFLGMASMLAAGWYQKHQVEQNLHDAAEVRKVVATIADLRSASLELALTAMDSIIDREEGKMKPERIETIRKTTTELAAATSVVTSFAATVAKQDIARDYAADVAKLSSLIGRDLPALIEARANADAFGKIDDLIDQTGDHVTGILDTLSTEGDQLANARMAEVQTLSDNIFYFQLMVAALAFVTVAILQLLHTGVIRRSLANLSSSMQRIADGDCSTPVSGTEGKDEIASMARSTERFRRAALEKRNLEQEAAEASARIDQESRERIATQQADADSIREATMAIASALSRLTGGDLHVSLEKPFRPDLEPIREDLNRLSEKLRLVMQEINQSSSSIQANAQQMRSAADDLAKRTEQQAASLEQTSAALEQITRTVRTATDRAEGASQMVSNSKDFAESSSKVVSDAMAAMERIEAATGEIGKIINVVEEIAFQTNLLALNAGVEAARAGEAGKGFAVVAQEVRELAGRASGAAKDIKALVTRSNAEVQTGVDLVKATGEALHRIGDDVLQINEHVSAIVTSAREQFVGLSEINSAIGQMDQTTQQNAAMVEETNASSHTLANDAETLARLMRQFRVNGSGPVAVQDHVAPAASVHRPSPARTLMNRVASAITSNSSAAKKVATESNEKWEEF